SFSHVPLQIATMIGFFFAAVAFLGIPVAIGFRIAGQFVPGITTTVIAVLLLGGIQLMAIGIIGEYVGRIYDEVKRRPLYVSGSRRGGGGGGGAAARGVGGSSAGGAGVGAGSADAAAAGRSASICWRFCAKVSISRPATSCTMPRLIAAARPLRRTSVVSDAF